MANNRGARERRSNEIQAFSNEIFEQNYVLQRSNRFLPPCIRVTIKGGSDMQGLGLFSSTGPLLRQSMLEPPLLRISKLTEENVEILQIALYLL